MSVDADPRIRPLELDQVFERVQGTVVPRLRAAVERLPGPMRDVVGYHFGWCDECGRPTHGRSGKLIRPALALLCAQAVGGTEGRAGGAAGARGPVRKLSLMHDDGMDGRPARRR